MVVAAAAAMDMAGRMMPLAAMLVVAAVVVVEVRDFHVRRRVTGAMATAVGVNDAAAQEGGDSERE